MQTVYIHTAGIYILIGLAEGAFAVLHEPLINALHVEFVETAQPSKLAIVFRSIFYNELALHVVK